AVHHHYRFIHLPITTTASPAHLLDHHHHHHQPSIHQNNTTAKNFSLSPSLLSPEQSHTVSTHPSSPLTLSILSLPHEVSRRYHRRSDSYHDTSNSFHRESLPLSLEP
ncbi:unnamed protein product, partial [Linum tenue]